MCVVNDEMDIAFPQEEHFIELITLSPRCEADVDMFGNLSQHVKLPTLSLLAAGVGINEHFTRVVFCQDVKFVLLFSLLPWGLMTS